jgi:hypothetical protein
MRSARQKNHREQGDQGHDNEQVAEDSSAPANHETLHVKLLSAKPKNSAAVVASVSPGGIDKV